MEKIATKKGERVKVLDTPIEVELVPQPIKLDIGCGKRKQEGYTGIDILDFEGVDIVLNVGKDIWPFEDNSVTDVYCSHVVEHLDAEERIHFVNELYRVLKPITYLNGQAIEGRATIITPHWASQRAYGDLTHKWPPVCEFWFYYLDKNWRATNAPHNTGYTCHFEVNWGYNFTDEVNARNPEYQQFAMKNYKDACADTIAYFHKKI